MIRNDFVDFVLSLAITFAYSFFFFAVLAG